MMAERFRHIATWTADAVGTAWAFLLALAVVTVWATTGPLFGFSDTWQLVINTGTTIATFLMVFLIQETQNRSDRALHLKLDELLRAVAAARTSMVRLEDLPEADIERLRHEYDALKARATPPPPDADGTADYME
jgi:low affinity Fe/Cu permease